MIDKNCCTTAQSYKTDRIITHQLANKYAVFQQLKCFLNCKNYG
jgi:hypothetical protein